MPVETCLEPGRNPWNEYKPTVINVAPSCS